MSLPDALAPHVRLVRLRAEAALIGRLNAGYGFEARAPARLYLRDQEARERLGRDALQPQDTHVAQAEELDEVIAEAEAALELHESPLTLLAARFALAPAELSLLTIAVAHQIDPDVRDLCDALSPRRRGGLSGDVAQEISAELGDVADLYRLLHPGATLRRELLLEVDDDRGSLATATLVANRRVLEWLLGDERLEPSLRPVLSFIGPRANLGVHLSGDAVDRIDTVADQLRAALVQAREQDEPLPMVLVQGGQGAGKRAAAHRLAAALGRPLAVLPVPALLDAARRGDAGTTRRALAEARLRGALPYLAGLGALDADDAREARSLITRPAEEHGGLLFASTRERGMPSAPIGRPFLLMSLPRPDLETRRAAWSTALAGLSEVAEVGPDTAGALAARYVIGPGTIGDVVRESRAFARASGAPVQLTDIEQAIGRRLTLRLGAFGTLITRRASFDQMVIPEDVRDTLEDMISMVRERSKILESWGYARHLGISRGVSALFSGAPGTGKTMAASVISSELGMDLIRIDLSSVVSKWVGETEKHLSKIFDEAQNASAMLVFDEADSLFGKRTEVKSAQDRYANLEVNYVLQRMETFDGICILTSNLEASIDKAFLRRLNFRIRFPEPDIDERVLLWKKLLPPEVALPDDTDFTRLARTFDMTGGHIKNAIVRAAVIAARQDRRLQPADLMAGAHLEYLELGKVMPTLQ